MKNIIGFFAAFSLAFALGACGTDDDNDSTTDQDTGSATDPDVTADPDATTDDDSGTNDDDSGTTGSMEAEAFTELISDEFCEKIFECCPNGVPYLENIDTCKAMFGELLLDDLNQGIANNMMSYDAASAGQCAAEIHDIAASLSCDELFEESPIEESAACRQAMQGLVAEGESCEIETGEDASESSDDYCADGLSCIDSICAELVETGGSCSSEYGEGCIEGNYCNSEGSCAPYLALGESCADEWMGCEFECDEEEEVCLEQGDICLE